MLALRFFLAPFLVALASLASRRFGERIGGWLSAFPFVAGPILLVLCLEQGTTFGAVSARSAVVGIISLAAFALAYAHLARGLPWWLALPVAWGAYLLASWLFLDLGPSLALRLALAATSLFLGWRLLPGGLEASDGKPPLPWQLDLPLRMAAAALLVASVAAMAQRMGPTWTGLLTPFPVATTVLVTFAHAQSGPAGVARLLKGFFPGLLGLALFFAVLAGSLVPMGTGRAFLFGLLTTAAIQTALLPLLLRARRD
jgi:hypothetical protein